MGASELLPSVKLQIQRKEIIKEKIQKSKAIKKRGLPWPLFHLFWSFVIQCRAFVASQNQTWIFRVEGKDADHYTFAAPQKRKT